MNPQVEQLFSQADSLATEFEQSREARYIDEAIVLDHQALDICTLDERAACLIQLSKHLGSLYDQLGGMEYINEAIVSDREALTLCPPGHPERSVFLNSLAIHLGTRYEQLGEVEDLNESIVLHQEALTLRPQGHPLRYTSLNNLALELTMRYRKLGGVEDINNATQLTREALTICPPGHPDRAAPLNNLGVYLCTRFDQLGNMEDLNEAIMLEREALTLRPVGHPFRYTSLINLALHLCDRHEQLGRVQDLSEAIVLDREALILCPPGHPYRSSCLNTLARHLWTRYQQLGSMEDLNEAIDLDREGLTLRPPGHPERARSLNSLAICLCIRYEQHGGMEDLNEAIGFDREALSIRSPGHPDRSLSLNNLSIRLHDRYCQLGGVEDLDEAILLDKEAITLRPPGHPFRSSSLNNLATHLSSRYNQYGALEDLTEAIILQREALALCPPGHPFRSSSLDNLVAALFTRYKQSGETGDREEMFRLYTELAHVAQTTFLSAIFAAKSWVYVAEEFSDPTTLLAYQTALQFLVHHIAALPSLPQHLGLLKNLASSLAVDAFSACLRNQSPTDAVTLLEQGRGVFWSQLTRLRSPLGDVIASGPAGKTLADEFTRITSLIRNTLNSHSVDKHDRVCHLNFELEKVVTNIRELPDLSRFLLPLLFSDLQRAATGGPVIIMNASKYSCNALIVSVDRDPVHIPLSITKEEVREMSSELRTLILRAKRSDMTKELSFFLRKLWDQVVSRIADYLRNSYPPQTRIWWCPTAEFSLLPLHAASPYRKGQKSLADQYVSSYTPTLSALIRARQNDSSRLATDQKHFLAIGQATASGADELLSVGSELANIGQCIDGLATFTCLEGEASCIPPVTEELSKSQWVHLACHGIPNRKQPFESAFALRDGRLTIQRIIQCDLQNPEFAYLSACHTTAGDEESPDEVIHLAAAMQFAGFRSVIGTMWAVDDAETNKITSVFYKHVVNESGQLDHTRAAYALWKTMKTVKIPLDQRMLYIHLGA